MSSYKAHPRDLLRKYPNTYILRNTTSFPNWISTCKITVVLQVIKSNQYFFLSHCSTTEKSFDYGKNMIALQTVPNRNKCSRPTMVAQKARVSTHRPQTPCLIWFKWHIIPTLISPRQMWHRLKHPKHTLYQPRLQG